MCPMGSLCSDYQTLFTEGLIFSNNHPILQKLNDVALLLNDLSIVEVRERPILICHRSTLHL